MKPDHETALVAAKTGLYFDMPLLKAAYLDLTARHEQLKALAQASLDASDSILLCHLNSDDDQQHSIVAHIKRAADQALREFLKGEGG